MEDPHWTQVDDWLDMSLSSSETLLSSIVSDLDLMLNDLCHTLPYTESRDVALLGCSDRVCGERPVPRVTAACRDGSLGSSGSREELSSGLSSEGSYYSLEGDQSPGISLGGSPYHSPCPILAVPRPFCIEPITAVTPREISMLERLIYTHPIWYLPNIGRAGAVHLLRSREEGSFLVRQSCHADTMALSVRVGSRTATEHYLLDSTLEGVCLEGATRCFSAIPLLILCYCENIGDLPVGLKLPKIVMEAKTHQELNALSLLGQDFWSSPVSQQPPVTRASLMKSVFHTTISPYQSGTPTALKSSPSKPAQSHAKPTLTNGAVTSNSSKSPPKFAYRTVSPPQKNTTSPVSTANKSSPVNTVHSQVNIVHSQQNKSVTTSSSEIYSQPKKEVNGGGRNDHNVSQSVKTSTVVMTTTVASSTSNSRSTKLARSASEKATRRRYVTRKPPQPLNSGQSQLEHSAESPFVTPVHRPGGKALLSPYYKGNLVDRLSDYEDIWSATPKSERQTPFFKPIGGGHSIESLIDQHRLSEDGAELSSVNPGYHSDTESELDFVQRSNYVNDRTKHETEHAKKTEKATHDWFPRHGRHPEPVMFTFDLPPPQLVMNSHGLIRSQPKNAVVNAGQPRNGIPDRSHQKPPVHSTASESPAYAEPVDSLIGKVEGATHTKSVQKVVNSFKHVETSWPPPMSTSMDKPVAMSTPVLNSFRSSEVTRFSPPTHPATLASVPSRFPSRNDPGAASDRKTGFQKSHEVQFSKNVSPPKRNLFKMSMQRLKEQERKENMSSPQEQPSHRLKVSLQKIHELESKKSWVSSHEEITMSPGYRQPIDVLKDPPGIGKAQSLRGLPGSFEPNDTRATSMPQCSQVGKTAPQKFEAPRSSPERVVHKSVASVTTANSTLVQTSHSLAVSQYFENIFKPDYLKTDEDDIPPPFVPSVNKFPTEEKRMSTCSDTAAGGNSSTTVEDLISDIVPELAVKQIHPLTIRNVQRISEYENCGGRSSGAGSNRDTVPSSAGTFYCSPWDSSNVWQELMDLGVTPGKPRKDPRLRSPFSASSAPDIWDETRDTFDEVSSAGEYSSVYADSEGTHAHSETMASELATSFEWQSESDIPAALKSVFGPSIENTPAVSAPAVNETVLHQPAPVVHNAVVHDAVVHETVTPVYAVVERKPTVERVPAERVPVERVPSERNSPEEIVALTMNSLSSGSHGNGSLDKRPLLYEKPDHDSSSRSTTERSTVELGVGEYRRLSLERHSSVECHSSPQPETASSSLARRQCLLPCVATEINVEQEMRNITQEAISEDEELEVEYAARCTRLRPMLACPRVVSLRTRQMNHAGVAVRDKVSEMARDQNTTFGKTVENFIQCTKEASETNPNVVVRNVRQFMSGIKNYLIQTGEVNLNRIIDSERSKLGTNEFLNIDAVLEGALHRCVIKPLKQHIYKLFVKEYQSNGSLQALSDNIKYARTKTPQELGIKNGLAVPEGASLEVIRHFLNKMQASYSPMKKLENLLGAVSSIYNSVNSSSGTGSSSCSTNSSVLETDDLLPMLIYLLSHCGVVAAEIELDYMWGLVHPCLMAGEGGYYLTTLSSAIQVLKNLRQTMEASPTNSLPSLCNLDGFLKVIIPDEQDDSITTKMVPVRRTMTTKDVCNIIATQFQITNPQHYGLYILVLGIEDQLTENAWPLSVKAEMQTGGRECIFAYKRNNVRYVWPVSFNR